MKILLQRVKSANVLINDKKISAIGVGILIFIGIEKNDDKKISNKMINRILNYRIFNDNDNDKKMNLNIQDVDGEILIVSQFTLAADTKSGTRAGFSTAMTTKLAERLYNYFIKEISTQYKKISTGVFGTDMQITLINDGPVSFILVNT